MSLQQVNLYLPEYRPKKEWLSVSSLALLTVCTVVMFTAFHLLSAHNLRTLQQQVNELEDRQLLAEKQVEKLKARAKPFRNNQLDSELRLLRAALKSRQQVEQIIENQNLGNSEGFSAAMEGMARQSLGSIALQRILLSEGGKFLQMSGVTQQPETVATYIQKLQQEASFKYTRFGLFSVGKLTSKSAHSFSLGFESVYDVALEEQKK